MKMTLNTSKYFWFCNSTAKLRLSWQHTPLLMAILQCHLDQQKIFLMQAYRWHSFTTSSWNIMKQLTWSCSIWLAKRTLPSTACSSANMCTLIWYGPTMHRVQVLWKSCLPGSKHWQVSKKAALKERHLLWLQGKLGWLHEPTKSVHIISTSTQSFGILFPEALYMRASVWTCWSTCALPWIICAYIPCRNTWVCVWTHWTVLE